LQQLLTQPGKGSVNLKSVISSASLQPGFIWKNTTGRQDPGHLHPSYYKPDCREMSEQQTGSPSILDRIGPLQIVCQKWDI